jgi:GNAT superfamily N-acetyltransferase
MPVGPAEAAAAVAGSWRVMDQGVPSGWVRTEPGVSAGVTGVAVPTLNGVLVESENVDPAVVNELLDEIAAAGVPHCLQCRPALDDSMTAVASARGMTREVPDTPLMVRDDTERLELPTQPGVLAIRELAPEEAHIHAEVAAAGFEVPPEPFLELMTPTMLGLTEVAAYLGTVDGVPVATGLGVRVGASIAVFNIGTPPEHRRKGYGAAITARIVEDGLSTGATWAWLQSSEAGYGVYESLGFRTVEVWPCWVTSESPAGRPRPAGQSGNQTAATVN